ncbi:hypothetical protein BGV52_23965 [Burkholderia ubonensis]|uniref:hypothetical protein n=1 Tax=Burkholderia ubonensis TaxID=101571 RepID=UPI0008FE63DA|nr:hypothetical protein [Burkholderia ubonensis]OJB06294.1 hypothetical protein BGV52_23965 [Burkholderia ubonensis]
MLAARAEGRTLRTVRLSASDKLSLAFDDDNQDQGHDGDVDTAEAPVSVGGPVAADHDAPAVGDATVDAGPKGEPACV